MRKSFIRIPSVFVLLFLVLCGSVYSEQSAPKKEKPYYQTFKFQTASDIFVVGDIHGAFDSIESTLKNSQLIDENNNWSGEQAHFVSLGDLMDRGPSSRKVLDLFMKLQTQASAAGGGFHVVLGNHEVMNLVGDLRYLSLEEINEFSVDETSQQRDSAFLDFLKSAQAKNAKEPRSEFDKLYPAGYFARRHAFSEEGRYGKWLLNLPFVIQINDQLFAHGGLSELTNKYSLQEFNQHAMEGLKSYLTKWKTLSANSELSSLTPFKKRKNLVDKIKLDSEIKKSFIDSTEHFILSLQGPTWYRGNAQCHPYFEQDLLKKALDNWQAKHLWVGHTTSNTRTPLTRLGGLLTIMDTGMLKAYYHGSPWLAKLSEEKPVVFINGLTGQQAPPDPSPNREWSNPYDLSDEALEQFLLSAKIKKLGTTKEGTSKPIKVELSANGMMVKGIFKFQKSQNKKRGIRRSSENDRFQHEIAAYKLDRLLGLGLVPVTVERKVNGVNGIIQVWIDDLISEMELKDKKITYQGYCDLDNQENMINTFDYLVSNRDRNQSNMLFSKSDMQIWFIDHSRSFGVKTKRPKMLRKEKIIVTERFKEALVSLNMDNLKSLSPWLRTRQIKAVLARRDKLLTGDF
ncbi:MAG: metallophosphoesterase [Kangiellaceae bacterium]|nr:metallophosphoesterase [Kangiellaceae bacterium]